MQQRAPYMYILSDPIHTKSFFSRQTEKSKWPLHSVLQKLITMNSLVKTKKNRYIKVNFQNRGLKCVSFREIIQRGCVQGYVAGEKSTFASTYTLIEDRLKLI